MLLTKRNLKQKITTFLTLITILLILAACQKEQEPKEQENIPEVEPIPVKDFDPNEILYEEDTPNEIINEDEMNFEPEE